MRVRRWLFLAWLRQVLPRSWIESGLLVGKDFEESRKRSAGHQDAQGGWLDRLAGVGASASGKGPWKTSSPPAAVFDPVALRVIERNVSEISPCAINLNERLEDMMATPREHRIEEERQDDERTIARANELSSGAKLLFNRSQMESALRAFMEYKRISQRFFNEAAEYLQVTGVDTIYGMPMCRGCDQNFSSDRQFANHMMSRDHFIKSHGTSLAIVNEVRSHLHAHPIAPELWRAVDISIVIHGYPFIGLA